MEKTVMRVAHDIEKFLEMKEVTKIQGQPLENDDTKLQKELGWIPQ